MQDFWPFVGMLVAAVIVIDAATLYFARGMKFPWLAVIGVNVALTMAGNLATIALMTF
jgi:hypothetical protein